MKRIVNKLGAMIVLRRIVLLSVAAELFLGSCTVGLPKLKFDEFPTLPASQYRYTEAHEGLAVAIQPMTSDETEKYFGTNLLASGVLAVFLLAENHSLDLSYLVNKDTIQLNPGNVTSDDSRIIHAASRFGAGEAMAIAPILAGPFMAYAVPLQFVGRKMKSNSDEIAYDLTLKELQTKMVSPSAQMSGFLYFNLPEGTASDNWTVHIEALEPTAKTVAVFNIEFPWRRK